MVDFDELDQLQEVLEPELLRIFAETRTPRGLEERCREKGLVTCERFYEAVDASRLHKDYEYELWYGGEELYKDLVELALSLTPPATRYHQHLRVRDAWRACRERTLAERAQREAEQQRLEAEEAERREAEARRRREAAREAAGRASERRQEAELRAAEEAEEEALAKVREQEAALQLQLEVARQAAAAPTFRGLVVAPSISGGAADRGAEGRDQSAAAALCGRLVELAAVLSCRYRGTDTAVTGSHVLDARIGKLSSGNSTIAYSAIWGLEVEAEPCGRRAVRLARQGLMPGGLVEVCPLVRLPLEAGSRGQHLRSGLLGRLAIWPSAQSEDVLLPLGYGCLYRRSAQGWNISPTLSGDELRWIASVRIDAGEELVAPACWQELAAEGVMGEDRPPGGQVEGPALGSTRYGPSLTHRFGVFSACSAGAGEVLDVCPALRLPKAEARILENYAMQFDSDKQGPVVVLALGLGGVYNHRKWPQVDWLYDRETDAVAFVTRQKVDRGEELFIDYGQVYFSSRGVTPSCCLANVVWRE